MLAEKVRKMFVDKDITSKKSWIMYVLQINVVKIGNYWDCLSYIEQCHNLF